MYIVEGKGHSTANKITTLQATIWQSHPARGLSPFLLNHAASIASMMSLIRFGPFILRWQRVRVVKEYDSDTSGCRYHLGSPAQVRILSLSPCFFYNSAN